MKGLPLILLFASLITVTARTALPALHSKWEDCILINSNGDSSKAQIRYRKDYSAEGSMLTDEQMLIRQENGTEIKLDLKTLTEISIPNRPSGSNHYLIMNTNAAYPGRYKVYRVITEGRCKLLYTEKPAKAGSIFIDPNNHAGIIALSDERLTEQYYVYYNHELTLVQIDDDYYLNSISKNACLEIFRSCTEVTSKLNDKKAKSLKLNLLIEQFNGCTKENN